MASVGQEGVTGQCRAESRYRALPDPPVESLLHRLTSDETSVRFVLSQAEMAALVEFYQSYLADGEEGNVAQACELACSGESRDEIPVGAILVANQDIIGIGANHRERSARTVAQ